MSTAPSVALGLSLAAATHCPRLLLAQALDGIDPDLGDGVGVRRGHGLDLDAALGREHAQVLLGRAVEREAGVVLLGDVGGLLDPHDLHRVALDVHAEDGAGMRADLIGIRSQLDAARLAPPTDLHLSLHHDRVADALGGGDGVVDRGGRLPRADGDAVLARRAACPGTRTDPSALVASSRSGWVAWPTSSRPDARRILGG